MRLRLPISRAGSITALSLAALLLAYGVWSLRLAYFGDLDPWAGLGAFFVGVGATTLAPILFWLALRLAPSGARWTLVACVAGASAAALASLWTLGQAGWGLGWFVTASLAGLALTLYEAWQRR